MSFITDKNIDLIIEGCNKFYAGKTHRRSQGGRGTWPPKF